MSPLALDLRARLTAIGDPARAPGMRAYMKSAMPYLGVSTVPLRQMCRDVFKDLGWPDSAVMWGRERSTPKAATPAT